LLLSPRQFSPAATRASHEPLSRLGHVSRAVCATRCSSVWVSCACDAPA
jgi:hypothetical protein